MNAKKVYALFPFDEDGEIAGVYVGSSQNPLTRVRSHKNTQDGHGKQDVLHELMRENGFTYIFVDDIKTFKDAHVEYDWIDYFIKQTNLTVFNNAVDLCQADWTRISEEKLSIPVLKASWIERKDIVYPNIKAVLEHRETSIAELSRILGVGLLTLTKQLRGYRPISVTEAVAIKKALGVKTPLEVLFEKKGTEE